MGKGQRFNKLFATLVDGAANDIGHAGDDSFGSGTAGGDSEIVIGLDKRVESMLRAVSTDSETGSEFSLLADDQYSVRQSKVGYYGAIEEGRMVLDDRALTGLVVCSADKDSDRPAVWDGDCKDDE